MVAFSAIKRLREAPRDTAETPRFIETIPRRGYRFLGAIQTAQVSSKPNGCIDSIAVFPLLIAAMQKSAQRSQRAPILVSLLGEAYAVAGRREDAQEILDELKETPNSDM